MVTFIGSEGGLGAGLAQALGATAITSVAGYPGVPGPRWERWAQTLASSREDLGHAVQDAFSVVVCTWSSMEHTPLDRIERSAWDERVEWPLALWYSTLTAAAESCPDGASVVSVIERPAALDAGGFGADLCVAEAIIALTRSLAGTEGSRSVRVNVVTTQLSTAVSPAVGAPAPLPTFPGTADREVAGAIRMLLGPDACGITGAVVRADCGNAWA